MKKIAMVVGEDFWLRIPMNNESAGRHLCMDDVEVIHAWLESGYGGCWTLPLETDGEQLEGVAVKVPGSRLGLGTYAVVMAGKFVNGGHFRTKRQLFIRLVDREEQADAKPTMFNEEKAYWAGPAVLSGMLSRDGLNTYELAVLHGYDGTLEQFLAQAGIELQDFMVTKAKLSREVQTQLDKGSEKAINPAGDYDAEAEYSVNEMVYDEVTNSSYVSKQSVNVGHAVTDTDWWMKVLDGNYVHTTIQAIMTAAQATLDEAKQDTIDATAAALAAKQATEQATAAANAVVAQKVADAQIGYYVCETAAGTATKATTTDTIGQSKFAVPVKGCIVKVKMANANTATDTVYLQFGSDANTKKELKYNGLAVDASNTWEDGEVISVFYDGTYYQASNAQGGGAAGKKKLNGTQGYYVDLSGETASAPTTEGGGQYFSYIKYPVKEGDVVEIKGKSSSAMALVWGLIDSTNSNTIVERAPVGADYSQEPFVKVIPSGVDYIILNNYNTQFANYEWYFAKKGSAAADAILGKYAEYTSFNNSKSGLAAENVQDALDETNILSMSENAFDITQSESINPSSANYSVTFDTENVTVTVATLRKIKSNMVMGGFTIPELVNGASYKYSFNYTNQVSNAHIIVAGVDRGGLAVGSGIMVFDTAPGSIYVSLPQNTASGKTVVFSSISVVRVDYLKDTVITSEARLTTAEGEINVLNKEVVSEPMVIPFSNMTEGVGLISPSTYDWNPNSSFRHYYFPRTGDMKTISLQGTGNNNSYIAFLKSYDYEGTPSGTPDYCEGYTAPQYFLSTATPYSKVLDIPDDCNYIVVDSLSTIQLLPTAVYVGYSIKSVVEYKDNIASTHRVPMEVGNINSISGKNSSVSYDATVDVKYDSGDGYAFKTTDGEFLMWRNTGLIELEGGSYTIAFDKGDLFYVILYNSKREIILSMSYNDVMTFTFDSLGAKFVRFLVLKKSETYPDGQPYVRFCEPKVTISGIFDEGLKIAKLDRQNNTCDTTIYPVWIENTYCCEDTTTDLQDTGEWHIDFGRIRFPENYDPDGEPVRMIIWCHGGKARYNPVYAGDSKYDYVAGNFDTQVHINPTLFLAEGYAVMDIDGVFAIFNEKEDSNGIRANSLPQTAHCYQAAYDYVINNYNIRTDGVLLGGISFGGSKSLQIMMHSHIPVIAAALESPYVPETVFVNGAYRGIIARSVGITGLSETGTLTDADIALIKEDYNEVITGTTDGYDNYFYRKYNYGKLLRALPILGACNVSVDDFFATVNVEGIGNISLQNNESVYWPKYVVANWSARFPVPIKMWCCTADETSVPYRNGQMLYAVGSNGGSDIELRMITGGSHTPSTGDGAGRLNITNYVTKYGQTLATVPLVYAEAIRFWRRYE